MIQFCTFWNDWLINENTERDTTAFVYPIYGA